MAAENYFHWLTSQTPTQWWHDSAAPEEIRYGLEHHASGATTNPVLVATTLTKQPEKWASGLFAFRNEKDGEKRTESLVQAVVTHAAKEFLPVYEKSQSNCGYVCAQVDPSLAADRDAMLVMARRFHQWAANIAVKLPATAAGLDVLEDCIAEGITITATVSFTVAQVVAIAQRHQKGIARALKNGVTPGKCFAVIMIGRLDNYLGDAAQDQKSAVSLADIRLAGLAVTKRAYAIYQQQGYQAKLIVAALRGTYHMEHLAGGNLIMSIHPIYQKLLLAPGVPRQIRIEESIDAAVVRRLQTIPEFVRAYEPDGMKPQDFITYGVTQRTLSQFCFAGWALIEAFKCSGG